MRTEPATSPAQLAILEHALGLDQVTPQRRKRTVALHCCYRNFYVGVRDNHAWSDLVELESRGVLRRGDTTCSLRTAMFVVTPRGFDVLRAHGRVPAIQLDLFQGAADAV